MSLFEQIGEAIGAKYMIDRNDEVVDNPWEHEPRAREHMVELRFYVSAFDNDEALELVKEAIKPPMAYEVELVMDVHNEN
tara:strand:+ start:195 stop:434 length:240 start_codon:yes stop_codon:yes gene_type:complete